VDKARYLIEAHVLQGRSVGELAAAHGVHRSWIAGSYELVERREGGSLLLRPEHERLSNVLRESEGQVFRDEEFAAHLERVSASEDDLPADPPW
jgi:hypothetical protein